MFYPKLFLLGMYDKENSSVLPIVKPEAIGTMFDKEGNEYTWVRYNG